MDATLWPRSDSDRFPMFRRQFIGRMAGCFPSLTFLLIPLI